MNNGTEITYNELLSLNGYVHVSASATELSTVVAQGDIGENELTSASTTYVLEAVNDSGIDGTVKFTKRVDGSTLVKSKFERSITSG